MTGFDYAVLAVLGLSVLLGLWRGVVGEVLGIAAWVAAFFAARWWGQAAGEMLPRLSAEPALRLVAGYVAVFVATLLAFGLARLLFSRLLRAVGLGLADRLLGAAFGVARGTLVVLALVLVGGLTSAPRQAWWREAWLAPPLQTAVLAAKPWLPQAVAQKVAYR